MYSDLKFNVDGSTIGKPGPAGIGGVLQDCNGKVLCVFSNFIGIRNSYAAEVAAIHKACSFCVSVPSLVDRNIEIVSDSKVAVLWINGEGIVNFSQVNLIYDIRGNLDVIRGKVSFCTRDSNHLADRLVKMGSKMLGDFVEWSDLG